MYEITITTPYNTIQFAVDDLEDDEVKEIIEQPWVKDVKIKIVEKSKLRKLIKGGNNNGRRNN